ncbi:MAG: class I fructose-bisphosphate aldolase [Paracoccaceae bacterium]|nr:class I fructose-bisphosphate aldolase [Paracoccaceae bacterium]
MTTTEPVQRILANFESDNPGVKANLCRMLMHGRLGGTGRMLILPVDQGFEHGPARSFQPNPPAYDPQYHFRLAVDAGLNALAAPLGFLEAGADSFAGQIPMILKANSANALVPKSSPKNQAVTASVADALRIGASAVGFSVYPGSSLALDMFEEITEMRREAAAHGLATVIWSYPRGEALEKRHEAAFDVVANAVQFAALLGAHVIKVKLPAGEIGLAESETAYKTVVPNGLSGPESLAARVAHCMQAALDSRRIVVFSGGSKQDDEDIYRQIRAIRDGGGNGSIIGRNTFQRSRHDALEMLDRIIRIYNDEA